MIDKNNRSIVNILGGPIIVASIIISKISFLILISTIIIFSFYEYFKLIKIRELKKKDINLTF